MKLANLRAQLSSSYLEFLDRVKPLCDVQQYPDGPHGRPVACSVKATNLIVPSTCQHFLYSCSDCLWLIPKMEWWWCPLCEKVTNRVEQPFDLQTRLI